MIEMQNVSFSYPDSADGGLKNINLTIPDEQCVLLCGRSGCGKTTLTRLINGLIPQFFAGELTGKVLLDGENLFDLPMYRIAEKVGSVFQNPRTQFFNVDTDSEIAFGMENEAVPQEQMGQRVVETAKALRIENLLGRNIFALSGGEKQKIAFASVYAMNPQIYLLDEPSSNLDMAAIHDLRAHLRLIKSQGKTIVVAEHRLYYLMDVADRIVYLDNGHIAGDWTPEQFRLLSTEKRQSMGLRALDLQDEKPICAAVPKQPPVLELQNVSLAYKKQPVLRNLSLQLRPEHIIAIVGHNGAGKTTLLRLLSGDLPPTRGSVELGGNRAPGRICPALPAHWTDARIIDAIRDVAVKVYTPMGRCPPPRWRRPFCSFGHAVPEGILLSGGEHRRLYLLRVLMAAPMCCSWTSPPTIWTSNISSS